MALDGKTYKELFDRMLVSGGISINSSFFMVIKRNRSGHKTKAGIERVYDVTKDYAHNVVVYDGPFGP